jgi:SAM-dependent methyltransferase
MNIYETRRLLDEYLLFHYGRDAEVLPWDFGPQTALGFAKRTVSELIAGPVQGDALDLGCAVGRSSFELADLGCRSVIGIDYSHSFAQAAEKIARGEAISYQRLEEGSAMTTLTAQMPANRKLQFEQGDAMDLRPDLGHFDVVHAANLLCRLTEPQRLIARLPLLVKPGGQLLLTTPCTWLADYTPPANWPAGSTREWLIEQLAHDFTLEHEQDLPFLIREHARKYQWTVAWGTRWRRR